MRKIFGLRNHFLFSTPKNLFSSKFIKCRLAEKSQISHDSYIYRFMLPDPNQTLGIKIGQHIKLQAVLNDETISRKYTPITKHDIKGYFDLLLKIYRKNANPNFPDGGKMTSYLENLNIGDHISVSGAQGNLVYAGNGKFLIGKIPKEHNFKKLGMIAGGTGITPMFQLIQAIGDDSEDKVEMKLLYANKKEEDILLKKELEFYEQKNKLKNFYTLDQPVEGWTGLKGFITKEMLQNIFSKNFEETIICVCGPPVMTKNCLNYLVEIGYTLENLYKF